MDAISQLIVCGEHAPKSSQGAFTHRHCTLVGMIIKQHALVRVLLRPHPNRLLKRSMWLAKPNRFVMQLQKVAGHEGEKENSRVNYYIKVGLS